MKKGDQGPLTARTIELTITNDILSRALIGQLSEIGSQKLKISPTFWTGTEALLCFGADAVKSGCQVV